MRRMLDTFKNKKDVSSENTREANDTKAKEFDIQRSRKTALDTSSSSTEQRILQKLGQEWETNQHHTNEGQEIRLYTHKRPDTLQDNNEESNTNDHFRLASQLSASPDALEPIGNKTAAYECFGDTLAHGKGKLERADAEKILNDNFNPVAANEVQPGDVIAYRYAPENFPPHLDDIAKKDQYQRNQLLHLGRVNSADHSEAPSEIYVDSKFGEAGKYRHEPHILHNFYGNNYSYYRPKNGDGSIVEA